MDFSRFTRFFLLMGASDILPFTRSAYGRTQFILLWAGYFIKQIFLIGCPAYFFHIMISWFALGALALQTVGRWFPRYRALLDDTPDWFPGGPINFRLGRLGTNWLLFTEPAIACVAMYLATQPQISLSPSFLPVWFPWASPDMFVTLARFSPVPYLIHFYPSLELLPQRNLGLACAFFGPACLLFNNVAEYIDLCRGTVSHHLVNSQVNLSFPTAG